MTKVAFVTGASRGIGRETALAFARAGFDVAISARTVEEGQTNEHSLRHSDGRVLTGSLESTALKVRELGRQALIVPMDLLDEQSVRNAAYKVLEHFGRVDVLVNNAIYQGADLNSEFLTIKAETLHRVFQGYVLSPVLLTQLVLARMIERGEGVVINVTSGAGETDPPVPSFKGGWGYAYAAGKAAVGRLSGVIATELGSKGISAYTVNPGVVTTEALNATIGESGVLAMKVGTSPPVVPAEVIRWLAMSPDARRYQHMTVQVQAIAVKEGIVPDWRGQ